MLQRSRTRVSAESAQLAVIQLAGDAASTEPHSCECGEWHCLRVAGLAAAWLQRSRTRVSAESCPVIGRHECFTSLQRSRTRVSAESPHPPAAWHPTASASTEPHSCECGEASLGAVIDDFIQASTEPHSCECGELPEATSGSSAIFASTEPHSCECGESMPWCFVRCFPPRFNGAALV